MLDIIAHRDETELAISITAIQRAFTDGVETDPLDDLTSFFRARDVGDNDPRGIGFKRPDIVTVAAAPHAHETVDVVHASCADLVF